MELNYESIAADFTAESLQILQRAEKFVLSLESGYDAATVDELFRGIHTIKGNSGLVNAPALQHLAHALESMLEEFRAQRIKVDAAGIDLMLEALDKLQSLIKDLGSKNHGIETVQQMVRKLDSIRNQRNDASPSLRAATPVSNGKGRIQIPAKHLQTAKANGFHLSFVNIDLLEQGCRTLAELSTRFRNLNGSVLMQGVMAEKLPDQTTAAAIPAYLLLLTAEEPESFLRANQIQFTKIRSLHTPAVPSALSAAADSRPAERTDHGEKRESSETHLRVPFRLVDHLINLAGEAVIARNELIQRTVSSADLSLVSVGKKIGLLITNLQEGIMRTRLQELSGVFQRIPRIVRDATASTGKKVTVHTEGGEVELDKTLMDAVSESLMHVIRNAVDHGIEAPQERLRLGKPEAGSLRVCARMRGGNVVFEIKDDGRGIDVEKIRRSAVSRGLMTAPQAESASKPDLLELVFVPGFSTASQVTATSGRGVGMDVVRTSFERAGGSVEVMSEPGRGTTILASLPQTLTITTCLLVRTCGTRYALPQQNVVELLEFDPAASRYVDNHLMYDLRGKLLPVIPLGGLLHDRHQAAGKTHIAVLRSEKHWFGVQVDDIINPEEIVVRSLGEHFADLALYSGAAILGDGEPVLILDVIGMARFAGVQADAAVAGDAAQTDTRHTAAPAEGFLVFETSGQLFAVGIRGVPWIAAVAESEIESFQGVSLVRLRGEAIPIARLDKLYDLPRQNDALVHLLIFSIDGKSAGIAASLIHSVSSDLTDIKTDRIAGRGVAGHTIYNGRTTIVLDGEALLGSLLSERFVSQSNGASWRGLPSDQIPDEAVPLQSAAILADMEKAGGPR